VEQIQAQLQGAILVVLGPARVLFFLLEQLDLDLVLVLELVQGYVLEKERGQQLQPLELECSP